MIPSNEPKVLQLLNSGRVWQFGGCPAGDIPSSDDVRMAREAAADTGKLRLSRTVSFIAMRTLRTSSGRISRVNKDHRDAGQFRLVRDKGSQLGKCPTMQDRSLAASNPNPITDTLQVLKGNRSLRALRSAYDLFADAVIYVGGKSLLAAASAFEQSFGRTGLFLLKLGTQSAMTDSHAANHGTGVNGSVTVSCDVGYSEVNAKNSDRRVSGIFSRVAGGVQVEHAISVNQILSPWRFLSSSAWCSPN
jgi:hypothetical protein